MGSSSLQVIMFHAGDFHFALEFLALPLWSEVVLLLPGLAEFTDNLNENIKRLEEEKSKLKAV